MIINKETIEKVARLSRIRLDEKEKAGMATELNKILSFMDKLNELNTDGIAPLIYLNDNTNAWREDKVHQELTREDVLKNAPQKNDDYFLVPKIIEK